MFTRQLREYTTCLHGSFGLDYAECSAKRPWGNRSQMFHWWIWPWVGVAQGFVLKSSEPQVTQHCNNVSAYQCPQCAFSGNCWKTSCSWPAHPTLALLLTAVLRIASTQKDPKSCEFRRLAPDKRRNTEAEFQTNLHQPTIRASESS